MAIESAESTQFIEVEVAYATPEKQKIVAMRVEQGTTAYDAVVDSGITDEFPGLDVTSSPMGIFSEPLDGKKRPLPAEYVLAARDRVEIYRPLEIDPKQARLARAAKKKS